MNLYLNFSKFFLLITTIKLVEVVNCQIEIKSKEIFVIDELNQIYGWTNNKDDNENKTSRFSVRKNKFDNIQNTESFFEMEIAKPRCLPLQSGNINANPYHESLLSLPGSQIFRGLSSPILLSTDLCSSSVENPNCTTLNSSSSSNIISDQIRIIFGRKLDTSSSKLFTNSIIETMKEMISNLTIEKDEYFLSQSVIQKFQQSFENSAFSFKKNIFHVENIEIFTHDFSSSNSIIGEYSVTNLSKYPFITNIYYNASIKKLYDADGLDSLPNIEESDLINEFKFGIGRGNFHTNSYISSSTYENRLTDNIYVLKELTVNGLDELNDETSLSNKLAASVNFYNLSFNTDFIQSCKMINCSSSIRVISVPYECTNIDNSRESVSAQYIISDKQLDEASLCDHELIDCKNVLEKNLFRNNNKEYIQSDFANTLAYGEFGLPSRFEKLSNNKKYSLQLLDEGNLVFKYRNKKIWENRMGLFKEPYYKIRIRINEKGHLVEGK